MIKDLTNFVRSFVYGEPPFPVCADSLYILKHILPEQIFVIVFAICVVGAFIERPYRIVQMVAILRSGIKVFDLKNYLHEWGAEALGYKVTLI